MRHAAWLAEQTSAKRDRAAPSEAPLDRELLDAALSKLEAEAPDLALAVRLLVCEEMSAAEAAPTVGLPTTKQGLDTLYKRKERGVKKLREIYAALEGGSDER